MFDETQMHVCIDEAFALACLEVCDENLGKAINARRTEGGNMTGSFRQALDVLSTIYFAKQNSWEEVWR